MNKHCILIINLLCSLILSPLLARKKIGFKKKYLPILTTLKREVTLDNLEIIGAIPAWLEGTLILTGPAEFEIGKKQVNTWFDGLALLHRYTIKDGAISYANTFLQSEAYKKSHKRKKIRFISFATDPQISSFWKRLLSSLVSDPIDNCSIGLSRLGKKPLALNETKKPIVFDVETLEKTGSFSYQDSLNGHLCCAHPHYDPKTNCMINYLVEFGATATYYKLYKRKLSSKKRELITSIPTSDVAYMHSFALTKNYIILAHIPFTTSVFKLLFRNQPFAQTLKWHPSQGTTFFVVNKKTGKLFGKFKAEPFFFFNHVNAFEENGTINLDLVAYQDPSIIKSFFLDTLNSTKKQTIFPQAFLKRFTINMTT